MPNKVTLPMPKSGQRVAMTIREALRLAASGKEKGRKKARKTRMDKYKMKY